MAPAVKIGSVTCGAKFHARDPPPKRPVSSSLPVPTEETRVMRGKKAARAAPMLALAPLSSCSACRMSGRRSRTSEGRPGEISFRGVTVLREALGKKARGDPGPHHEVQGVFVLGRRSSVYRAMSTRAVSTLVRAWSRSRAEATPASKRLLTSR